MRTVYWNPVMDTYHVDLEPATEEIELFNPLTTKHEVFAIRNGYAYIGYRIPNGNFQLEVVPYTEPEWSREITSNLPGVDASQVIPSNPQMVKESFL